MKKWFFVGITLVFIGNLNAQGKYPSLLWEIKKDNMRPSYIYGTMHVSERIAFHLSDVFFEKLNSTDLIALESNPEIWLDEIQKSPGELSMFSNAYQDYLTYQAFQRSPIENFIIRDALLFNDLMLNGILYRTHQAIDNYQEDTYLDMFIFQAGKRSNREIISLEDFTESRKLVEKAVLSNQNFDPPVWAKKLMMDKPIQVLMEDAYRDKNLDMIDSLNRGSNSESYNEFMLYKRNRNMVKKMDSIMDNGKTMFIGIGAAHLPGNNGVIELLRNLGYSVNAVTGEYTQKGRDEKEKIDHAYRYDTYHNHTTSDGFLSLKTPGKLYEFELPGVTVITSPDLKNGSFINILRIRKNDFLRKDNYRSSLKKIDSLLYEYIPGKILQKDQIKIDGFDAFDVKNQTREGDAQRYWIVSTPLEYLIICMLGKNEFVEKQSEQVAPSIKIQRQSAKWATISPHRGGYSVNAPTPYTIVANNDKTSWLDNTELLAYDKNDSSYYFVIEKTMHDTDFLEETDFELKRIHYEFYKKLKLDSLNGDLISEPLSYRSEAKLTPGKNLKLKSMINGSHYYLLGSTADTPNSEKFFDSFKFEKFNYYKQPVEYQDSILKFTVTTQIKPIPSQIDYSYFDFYYKQDLNHFEGKNLTRNFPSDSRQNITVNYREFQRYEYFENVDSLWNNVLKNNLENNELKPFGINKFKDENGNFVMNVHFQNENSAQLIKSKYLTNGKYFYSIKTLVNKDYDNDDPFIETFYDTFEPDEQPDLISVFSKKSKLYLEDIKSPEDSIRNSALELTYSVKFTDEDFPVLADLLENFGFKSEEEIYKNDLILKIGELNHPQAQSFLENYYLKNSTESALQVSVLQGLASNREIDYATIPKLLNEDIPLPSDTYDLYYLFDELENHGNSSSKIIKDLLKYRAIPEYQNPLIKFSANMLDSGFISPSKIKPYRKEFLTLAKLELKRSYSIWLDQKRNKDSYYNYNSNYFDNLKKYLVLLQPFSEENEINQFLNRIDTLDVTELNLFSMKEKFKNNDEIPLKLMDKVAKDNKSHWDLYQILKNNKKLNLLPKSITKESIALSAVLNAHHYFNAEEDSIEFISLKKAVYGQDEYEIYFFKTISTDPYNGMENKEIAYVAFELDKDGSFETSEEQETTFYQSGIQFIDDEYLEKTYKNEIDRVLFHDRKRVSFDQQYYNGYYGY